MEAVLVTGGAGYVGSHVAKALARAGFLPVVFDDLSTGHAEAVKWGPLVRGDLMDRSRIDEAMAGHRPVAVIHCAALSLVGEASLDPGRYWRVNVAGGLNLIEATVAAGVPHLIFSSSCAVYGDRDSVLLTEETPTGPANAYGSTKRAIEEMLDQFARVTPLRHVIFRYFNVAGADPEGEIGEAHDPETHLVPLLVDAIGRRRGPLTVFGTDYPTRDGTCIRDYVHVSDLAEAHVLGLKWLRSGGESRVFCLGSGTGFSVREVVAAAARATNRDVPVLIGDRRPGDTAVLVSGSRRAAEELGWRPERSDMETMIRDAWLWAERGGFARSGR